MLTIWLCIESIFGTKMYFKIEIVPRIKVNDLSKHGISVFSLYLNLVTGLHGHNNHAFCLLYIIYVSEKMIFCDLIHFHYVVILASPKGPNPWPMRQTFNNFGGGLHEYQINAFSLYPTTGSGEEDFLRWNKF